MVISCQSITSKISIKKAAYRLKPLEKIINEKRIINEEQWQLLQMISFYYFFPLSSLLKYVLPSSKILQLVKINTNRNNKKLVKKENAKPLVLFGDDFTLIKEQAKKTLKKNQQILFIFPNQIKLEYYFNNLTEWQKEIFVANKKNSKKFLKDYQAINNNEIKIIFGKRSVPFLPFNNLGLIILVDESNIGHKTLETKIHYDAKKVAFFLQKIWLAQLIIVNQTLSIETVFSLAANNYQNLNKFIDPLPNNKKFSIENNPFKQDNIFNARSIEAIKKSLTNKRPIIIFNNRLGHSPALICNNCGYVFRCPYCEAALVYHKDTENKNFLICHHCGYKISAPDVCPNCQSYLIKFIGIGNQKIEENLKNHFPKANIGIFDSDHLKNITQEKEVFQKFINNEYDILIITELFLKFFDFISQIETIIIPSIEQLLVTPDFENDEKIRQILTLFSFKAKNIFIQTIDPNKKWLAELLKNDFYAKQIEIRKKAFYPPFSQMIKIEIKAKNLNQLNKLAQYTYQLLEKNISNLFKKEEFILSVPLSPTVPKIKKFYLKDIYWRLKIMDKKNKEEQKKLFLKRNAILKLLPDEVNIEIDPANLF